MDLTHLMFWLSSTYILPLWGMMWFAPRHKVTKKIVGNIKICVFPLLIPYTILVLPNLPEIFITLGSEMPTPALVIEFFSDDTVKIIGWLHFLAFDILAGRYIWLRMLACDRPIFISTPTLILGMMVAPLGCLIGILATLDYHDKLPFPVDNK